jgi:hypothetical protein
MEKMTYKYKWIRTPFLKKFKNKVIPLKADKTLFTYVPVIEKGKYKGYMGVQGMVLCMVF